MAPTATLMRSEYQRHRQQERERLALAHGVCDEFERACQGDPETPLDVYLERAPAGLRGWMLQELLAIQVDCRSAADLPSDRGSLRLLTKISDAEFTAGWSAALNSLEQSQHVVPPRQTVGDATIRFLSEETTAGETPAAAVETIHFDGENPPPAGSDATIDFQRSKPGPEDLTLSLTSGKSSVGRPTPKVIGDYELLDELGRGGMGVVLLAHQHSLSRQVALKIIPGRLMQDQQALARFYLEAEISASLDHPNIVPVYDFGENNDVLYFAMALVQGGSLRDFVGDKGKRYTPRQVAEVMEKVCRGVQYAHNRAIIHRDIKPANILLDANGEPRLTDFGLAKMLNSSAELTVTGAAMGTPAYMAPEQVRGDLGAISTKTDVYGLGATMFHLLAGRPPFKGASNGEVMDAVVRKDPPSLRTLAPDVPFDLQTICQRCLAKLPQDRYESAQDLAEDLRRYLDGYPIAARPVGYFERTWRWCGRNPGVAALIAAVALSLVGGAAASTAFGLRANSERDRANALANQKTAALDAGKDLIDETFNIAAEQLRGQSGLQPVRRDWLERARNYYEELTAISEGDGIFNAEVAETYRKLGQVLDELGKRDEAAAQLRQALSIQNTLSATAGAGVKEFSALATTYQALSNVAKSQYRNASRSPADGNAGDTSQVHLQDWIDYADQGRTQRERCVELAPESPEYPRLLANSIESGAAARLEAARQAPADSRTPLASDAIMAFEKAQAVRQEAIEKFPQADESLSTREDLARGYYNLANARLLVNPQEADFKQALVDADAAVAAYQSVISTIGDADRAELLREQANALLLGAQALRRLADYENALQRIEEAIDRLHLLCVRNPQGSEFWTSNIYAHTCLVDLAISRNDADSVLKSIHNLQLVRLAVLRADPSAEPTAEQYRSFAMQMLNYGRINAIDETLPHRILEDSIDQLSTLIEEAPREYEWLRPQLDALLDAQSSAVAPASEGAHAESSAVSDVG